MKKTLLTLVAVTILSASGVFAEEITFHPIAGADQLAGQKWAVVVGLNCQRFIQIIGWGQEHVTWGPFQDPVTFQGVRSV